MKVHYASSNKPLPEHFTGILVMPWAEFYIYIGGKRVGHTESLEEAQAVLAEVWA
jgi:hypothetical protein